MLTMRIIYKYSNWCIRKTFETVFAQDLLSLLEKEGIKTRRQSSSPWYDWEYREIQSTGKEENVLDSTGMSEILVPDEDFDRAERIMTTLHIWREAKVDLTSTMPRVFISYSWDIEEHKKWVEAFSARLLRYGVNVRLDQWHLRVGQSPTQFMEAEVHFCDFTLVICTKDYCHKLLMRSGGVGYEQQEPQQIITGSILLGVPREKFIPVVRDGEFMSGAECAIPVAFLGIDAVDMRGELEDNHSIAMRLLLKALFKKLKPVAESIEQPW